MGMALPLCVLIRVLWMRRTILGGTFVVNRRLISACHPSTPGLDHHSQLVVTGGHLGHQSKRRYGLVDRRERRRGRSPHPIIPLAGRAEPGPPGAA